MENCLIFKKKIVLNADDNAIIINCIYNPLPYFRLNNIASLPHSLRKEEVGHTDADDTPPLLLLHHAIEKHHPWFVF